MAWYQGSQSRIFYEQIGDGPDIVWVGGGGTVGRDWQRFQTPHFAASFCNTTYDNRGIGQTACDAPMPWTIEDFARDAIELAGAVCRTPATFIGSSLGSAIVQQIAIERPDLVRSAIVMGTGAWSTGWGWDYQAAEIAFRRGGGSLPGMMGVAHYAAMLYPARALGDRVLWPKLKALLLEWMETDANETSLVPQWDASLRYDQRAALAGVTVPVHVVAFAEDVEAPPQDGEEVARLIPGAEFHLLDGMGHGSWYGHAHDRLNPFLEALVRRHL
jgi:pimeloyl-ACP methyl ester carboxylesterase